MQNIRVVTIYAPSAKNRRDNKPTGLTNEVEYLQRLAIAASYLLGCTGREDRVTARDKCNVREHAEGWGSREDTCAT